MGKLKKKFLDWLFEGYNNEYLDFAKKCIAAADESTKHAEKCIANSKSNFNFAKDVMQLNDTLVARNGEILKTSKDILLDMEKMRKGYRLVIRQHMSLINAVSEHEDSEAIFNRFASMLADDKFIEDWKQEASGESNNDESTEKSE